MKHLLIILSILLLSSPLFSQETGVLYQNETSSGVQWKTFGDGKVQPKYEGQITFGEPNGYGTLTKPDGGEYVGLFKDGKLHGQGTLTLPYRDKYVGEFKDGREHGQGTFTFFDGLYIYVGEYKEGKKHGQGTFTTIGGDKYVGAFKDGNFWNGTTY